MGVGLNIYKQIIQMETKQKRQIIPPHTPPADYQEYLKSCSEDERKLVELAIEKLGSSYFMEKSHGYKAWKAKAQK